jgi:hypothetical protein
MYKLPRHTGSAERAGVEYNNEKGTAGATPRDLATRGDAWTLGADWYPGLVDRGWSYRRSIDVMLKSESVNVYRADLSEEDSDLGKLYSYRSRLIDRRYIPQVP